MHEPELDNKTLVLISAAVAAALGRRKGRITRIRLIRRGNQAWRDQGRVAIQASHSMWKQQT